MPMIYLPDVVRATVELLKIQEDALKIRTYNITAMSFTPQELAEEIRKYVPEFTISYSPDPLRQRIGEFVVLLRSVICGGFHYGTVGRGQSSWEGAGSCCTVRKSISVWVCSTV